MQWIAQSSLDLLSPSHGRSAPCYCALTSNIFLQLRQSQTYCTDGECLDEPNLPRPESAGNSFITMFLMMALAVVMYAMRPRRTQIQDAAKPSAANSQV